MLDAVFQFTDFEAFHGAELDTDIVLDHRKWSRRVAASSKKLGKSVEKTQEMSGKAYQLVSLSSKKDHTSSSSTVKKVEAPVYQKVKVRPEEQATHP